MLKKHHKKQSLHPVWHMFGVFLFIGFFVGIIILSGFLVWAATIELPDFSLFEQRKVTQSTKIYDRTGKILLYDVHKDIRRTVIPFEDISPYIKNATVAIEDDSFYRHFGIKPESIVRAILVNARTGGYTQGGSTITQQVIKMALLTNEKTISRKLKEWILAIRLERTMSKEQILALYLNEAPYGGSVYGVEEASRSFFGKSAKEVDLAEAAYLAALPQAPTLYSPYGSNIDRLTSRKNAVLKKMLTLGMITQDDFSTASNEKVVFIPQAEQGIRAPHFVMYIKEQLAQKYGEDLLNEGGLNVVTTIDMDLQEKAEKILSDYAKTNLKAYNASNDALVAIDPKTGEILTMVGSRDYFDKEYDGNFNIALAKRQPGSSFKPFVYAASFEKGYTPDTVLFDLPTEFNTHCDVFGKPTDGSNPNVCYMPENYDHNYRGPMTLRNALAQSINVPAVKLLYLVGIDNALDFVKRVGLTTLADKARYGLTLVLGGGEVSLLEMTSAYGVFANDGVRIPYQGILKVSTNNGNILEEYKPNPEQVMSPEVARNITSILSDNIARTPAYGAQSFLYFPDHEVAVKTGTTNDYRDTWIIGYTPSLVVGTWAGNNDNSPMEKKVAGFIVAPIWNAFFKEAFVKIPNEHFPQPLPIPTSTKPALRGIWYGSKTYTIDKYSGKLATDLTPPEAKEERVILDPHEILHWVDKDNPTGPVPTDPTHDQQYWLWELPVQAWVNLNGVPQNAIKSVPSGYDDVHTNAQLPVISIVSPTASSTCVSSERMATQIDVKSSNPIKSVDLFLNNTFVGSLQTPPYIFTFIPNDYGVNTGLNELKVIAHDNVENQAQTSIDVNCDSI